MCGEKAISPYSAGIGTGSPPRVRGKETCRPLHCAGRGITPACAGKRTRWFYGGESMRDHPRVCGEKFPLDYISHAQTGSPPRVRGKVAAYKANNADLGITPACAGKRTRWFYGGESMRDHPRVCGEKWRRAGCKRPYPGSPPRVRGKARRTVFFRFCPGITPACAGKRD